jgi:hypothetical protein
MGDNNQTPRAIFEHCDAGLETSRYIHEKGFDLTGNCRTNADLSHNNKRESR